MIYSEEKKKNMDDPVIYWFTLWKKERFPILCGMVPNWTASKLLYPCREMDNGGIRETDDGGS